MSLLDAEMQLQRLVQDTWLPATASAGDGKLSTDVKGVGILPILKGGSNPTKKIPKMITINKLSFLWQSCGSHGWEAEAELGTPGSSMLVCNKPSQASAHLPLPLPASRSPKTVPFCKGRRAGIQLQPLWVQVGDKPYGKDRFFAGWRTVSDTAAVAPICAVQWTVVSL